MTVWNTTVLANIVATTTPAAPRLVPPWTAHTAKDASVRKKLVKPRTDTKASGRIPGARQRESLFTPLRAW